MDRAKTIRMLREMGFSLGSIKGFLNTDNLNAARRYFELQQLEVEEELKSIQHKKEMLHLILEVMERNNSIDCFNVVEKDIPRKTVLSVCRILLSYAYVRDFRKNGRAVRRALARWLEVNGYGLDGVMFNTPHVSSLDDPDPGHGLMNGALSL
jgi:DNA-binding transcriptional MerR regulator